MNSTKISNDIQPQPNAMDFSRHPETLMNSLLSASMNMSDILQELNNAYNHNNYTIYTMTEYIANLQQYLLLQKAQGIHQTQISTVQLQQQQQQQQPPPVPQQQQEYGNDRESPIQLPIHAFQPANEELIQSPEIMPISYDTYEPTPTLSTVSQSRVTGRKDQELLGKNAKNNDIEDMHMKAVAQENFHYLQSAALSESDSTFSTPEPSGHWISTTTPPVSPEQSYRGYTGYVERKRSNSKSKNSMTNVQASQCSICNKVISRDMSRHLRTHSETPRFQCIFPHNYCRHRTGRFHRPYDFKKHLLNYHFKYDDPLLKKFQNLSDKLKHAGTCSCGMRFEAKDWLENHILTNEVSKRCPYVTKES